MTSSAAAERLPRAPSDRDVRDLAVLLVDAVESGAAVSFVWPLTVDAAETWWRANLAALHERGVVLVVRDEEGIVGCVELQPAWAPNQPHRAEVVKLLVHRRARRAGLGRRLMEAVEDEAQAAGYTLLTLDAKQGAVAEQLYRDLGWTYVGAIPRFAVDPDGVTPHGAVIFYKDVPG